MICWLSTNAEWMLKGAFGVAIAEIVAEVSDVKWLKKRARKWELADERQCSKRQYTLRD